MTSSRQASSVELSKGQRWMLLAVVAAGLLLITLDNSILYTALPTLTAELGASATQGLWIINIYPLVMAGLLLGAGTLGDRVGHRRMFLHGLLIFGAASLMAAFSPGPAWLIAARALLAVGAAAMMPATLALIGLVFLDPRERSMAIAIWGSLAIVGSALGPIVGGTLLQYYWWGSVFLINVPVVAVTIAGTLALAPKVAGDPSRPWDAPSSVLALLALSGLVVALKESISPSASVWLALPALFVSMAAAMVFVHRQRRLAHPLLDVAIFRNPAFLAGTLSAACTLFALAGLQLATTQRFQLVAGFSPLEAGLLVSVVAFGSLPSALWGASLLHRIGLRPLIAGGLGLGAVGVALVAWMFDHGMPWLLGGLLLTGFGLGAAISVASSAIIGNVPRDRLGMASSVEEVSYEFGALLAVALLGSLGAALYPRLLQSAHGMPDALKQAGFDSLLRDVGSHEWLGVAASAYDKGYMMVLVVIVVVLVAGAMITGTLLRGRAASFSVSQTLAH